MKALEYAKASVRQLHPRLRVLERRLQQQGVPVGRTLLHRQRHFDLRRRKRRSEDAGSREDTYHALWPVGPVGHPTELQLTVPILAFKFTKYPNAAKAFIAFMLEKDQFEKWLSGARGYLTQTLNAYNSAPVWTADPKNAVFAQASKRALPASGIGTPDEKAATAIADFLVVDMFANYCTGAKDAKSSIAETERQLKRIYR